MREQEKKRQRTYNLLNTETKLRFLCLPFTNQRKNFYNVGWRIDQRAKKRAF